MIFLLDTNAVAALAAEHPGFMERRLGFLPRDFGLSSIVAFELMFGIHRSARIAHNLQTFEKLQLEVLAFDRDDARVAGEIRASLSRSGTPIGPYDLLIAGQALARDLTLVTRNIREFERVPGLRVENWQDG